MHSYSVQRKDVAHGLLCDVTMGVKWILSWLASVAWLFCMGSAPVMPSSAFSGCAVCSLQKVATPECDGRVVQKEKKEFLPTPQVGVSAVMLRSSSGQVTWTKGVMPTTAECRGHIIERYTPAL